MGRLNRFSSTAWGIDKGQFKLHKKSSIRRAAQGYPHAFCTDTPKLFAPSPQSYPQALLRVEYGASSVDERQDVGGEWFAHCSGGALRVEGIPGRVPEAGAVQSNK